MRPAQTRRQRDILRILRELAPWLPKADFDPIADKATAGHLRHLPASIAVRQALTTHARHAHTEYDHLLAEGYDADSARHFVLEAMNDVLRAWGAPTVPVQERGQDETVDSA